MCINMVRMGPEECDNNCGVLCYCDKLRDEVNNHNHNQSPDHGIGTESSTQESPLARSPASKRDPRPDERLSDPKQLLVTPKLEPGDPLTKHPIRNCQVVLTDFTKQFVQLLKQESTTKAQKRAPKRRKSVAIKDEPVDHEMAAHAAKRIKREPSVPAKLLARAKIVRRNTIQVTAAPRTSTGSGGRHSLTTQVVRPPSTSTSSSLAMLHLDEVIDDLIKSVTNNP